MFEPSDLEIDIPVTMVTEGEDISFFFRVQIENDMNFEGNTMFDLFIPAGFEIQPQENDIGRVTVVISDEEGIYSYTYLVFLLSIYIM